MYFNVCRKPIGSQITRVGAIEMDGGVDPYCPAIVLRPNVLGFFTVRLMSHINGPKPITDQGLFHMDNNQIFFAVWLWSCQICYLFSFGFSYYLCKELIENIYTLWHVTVNCCWHVTHYECKPSYNSPLLYFPCIFHIIFLQNFHSKKTLIIHCTINHDDFTYDKNIIGMHDS